jgi:nitrogenase-associated protein
MAKIVFFEKPGCANNARQKALLAAAGHEVDARNLLTERWTAQRLRPFFGARPVAEWFNRAAPRVKSGEVVPEQLDEASAIALMLAEPLLIRRPLLQVGNRCEAGFDQALVDQWIGLGQTAATPPAKGWETCTKPAHAKACATKDQFA